MNGGEGNQLNNYLSINNGNGGGWSGLKMRATRHCTVTNFVSINDYNGFKLEAPYPTDADGAHGLIIDGNYVQGTLYNWTQEGGMIDLDMQNCSVFNNVVNLQMNGNGLSNYGFVILNEGYNASLEAKNNNITQNTFNIQVSHVQNSAFYIVTYNNSWITDNTFNIQINNCTDATYGIGLDFAETNNNNSLILKNTFNINVKNCVHAYLHSPPTNNSWTDFSRCNDLLFYNAGSEATSVNGTAIAHGLFGTPTSITLTMFGQNFINSTCWYLPPTVYSVNSTHIVLCFTIFNAGTITAVAAPNSRTIGWDAIYKP